MTIAEQFTVELNKTLKILKNNKKVDFSLISYELPPRFEEALAGEYASVSDFLRITCNYKTSWGTDCKVIVNFPWFATMYNKNYVFEAFKLSTTLDLSSLELLTVKIAYILYKVAFEIELNTKKSTVIYNSVDTRLATAYWD